MTSATRTDAAARILGEGEKVELVPTPLDLEKILADKQPLSELIFGIPPSLYDKSSFLPL